MASFVILHVVGTKFLETLEKKYNINLTEEEKNKFLMGNLIVDSVKTTIDIPNDSNEEVKKNFRRKAKEIVQEEKRLTHFRDERDYELVVQVPKVDDFKEKYITIFNDITTIAYLFHLYTDKMFFEYLFDESFEFLDKDNNQTKYIKDISLVRVKKNNQFHNLNDFFDHKYEFSIYKDYTTMNKVLLKYYNIKFDYETLLKESSNFINPGIEEVDYSKIINVINNTKKFIEESYMNEDSNLNIFDLEKIYTFPDTLINEFINKYGYYLNITNNQRITKIKQK